MNEPLSNVVFVDPPPVDYGDRKKPGKVQRFVAVLQQRPGEWAIYPHTVATWSVSMYRAKYPGVEWTVRKRPDNRYDVYGRWIGEPS